VIESGSMTAVTFCKIAQGQGLNARDAVATDGDGYLRPATRLGRADS